MAEEKTVAQKLFGAEDSSAAALNKDKLNKHAALAIRIFHTPVLTLKEMMFPAISDFANRFIGAVNSYQTMYLVMVLRVDMFYVMAIRTLISIWDVLNDPLMGIVYDRTRTRWGKARPYLMGTPIPYYVSIAAVYLSAIFFNNANTADPRKVIYLFVVFFLQETFATIYNLPKGNLAILMTPHPNDRIVMGLIKGYADLIGGQIMYATFNPFMDLADRGLIKIPLSYYFAFMAMVACVIAIAGNMGLAVGTRERVILPQKPVMFTKSMFYILKNKYSLRQFIAGMCVSWFSKGGYDWDVVRQRDLFGDTLSTLACETPRTTGIFLSVTLVPLILRVFGANKRNGQIFLFFLDSVRATLQWLVCGHYIKPDFKGKNHLMFCIWWAFFMFINGMDNSSCDVIGGELGREIADYTEYMTGERPDGTQGILTGFISRLSAPLNAAFTIVVFKWTGYNPSLGYGFFRQQNVTTYKRLFFLETASGILPGIAGIIPWFFYDLVGEKREQMYVALNERRALLAKEPPAELEMIEEAMAKGEE
ncbi:MAG: MFS transporter [Oscillospiraceae bacterium]|nr:MFS transporter [Oscillospiraceae bacterium]